MYDVIGKAILCYRIIYLPTIYQFFFPNNVDLTLLLCLEKKIPTEKFVWWGFS